MTIMLTYRCYSMQLYIGLVWAWNFGRERDALWANEQSVMLKSWHVTYIQYSSLNWRPVDHHVCRYYYSISSIPGLSQL
jgi:hypothetical protein